jgi:hypothetical protein
MHRPATRVATGCCQGSSESVEEGNTVNASPRRVNATRVSIRSNAEWRDRREPHQIALGRDDKSDVRLIMFETANTDSAIVLEFLTHARVYHHQHFNWSFDHPYIYNPTSPDRRLVAGWKNYMTGEFAYVIVDPADELDEGSFQWTNNSGQTRAVDSCGWQATNWLVTKNTSVDGPDFFVGLQIGRYEDDGDATHIVFRPQYLRDE